MLTKIRTASLSGLAAEPVTVETDLLPGLPQLNLVGLPDMTVRESRERIRSGLVYAGYKFPACRITVSLAPANTRKEGSHFDLPIALGIAASMLGIDTAAFADSAVFGELSLDGSVQSFPGALPLVIGLMQKGIQKVFLPPQNALEVSLLPDIRIYPVSRLDEVVSHFAGTGRIAPQQNISAGTGEAATEDVLDFSEVRGQQQAKRALSISAAGHHHICLSGPPGVGKTMLIRRMPGILPPLTFEETLEVTQIYSVAGALPQQAPLVTARPFRAPHHTISAAALIGGGSRPRPGEISLAHQGVLFLDEFAEFPARILAMLRQPVEDGLIDITRGGRTMRYPCRFILATAMNPCPCGFAGDPHQVCRCSPAQIARYQGKLSGPAADRIDLHIRAAAVDGSEFLNDPAQTKDGGEMTSARIRSQVAAARQLQLERYRGERVRCNGLLSREQVERWCVLRGSARQLFQHAYRAFRLSARSATRLLRLSRTIADLEQAGQIREEHVAEALAYRMETAERREA